MPTTSTRGKNSAQVQFAVARRGVPSAGALRAWAEAAQPGNMQLTLRIVGSAEARRLNRDFRQKDYATNVLSFPYGNGSGDIVLCHPVVAREAREQGKLLRAHYAHLVVHGVLHLRGYDHESSGEADRMERAETRILGRLGFGDPYAVK